jgi:hypothetical protein
MGGSAASLSPNRPRLPSGAGRSLETMVDSSLSGDDDTETSIDLSAVPDLMSLTVSAPRTTL